MAATLDSIDNLREARVWHDQVGYHAMRSATVTGLDNSIVLLRMFDAQQVAGIPKWGDLFADASLVPGPIVVSNVSARLASADDTSTAFVDIQYDPIGMPGLTDIIIGVGEVQPGGARVSVHTTVQEVTTMVNVNGQPVILYKNGVTVKPDKDSPDAYVSEFIAYVPTTIIRFERREKDNPRGKAQEYVGRVDPGTVFGDPPRSWMCTRLDGTSIDGGVSYLVVYEFQKNVNYFGIKGKPTTGWDPIVRWRDRLTGQPDSEPNDADGYPGVLQAKATLTADFRRLKLMI